MKIGVLALQGAFIEHINVMQQLGVEASPVRLPGELNGLDGLIIPGGESTSILNLMHSFNLVQPLRELAQAGLPILGTCAGKDFCPKAGTTSSVSKLSTCLPKALRLTSISISDRVSLPELPESDTLWARQIVPAQVPRMGSPA